MNRAQVTISSVWVALFIAACGSSGSSGGSTPGVGGSGGGSSNPTTGGAATTGGATMGVGGTNAGPTGGVNAGPTGGVNAGPTGGVYAGPTGGVNAGPTGGVNAGPTGGANTGPTGGKGNTGGSSANATGGSTSADTGPTGGKGNTGGTTSAGGQATTGGSSSVAGSTSTGPEVITSASGNYWKTGTLTVSTGTADVTVNDTSASQTWEGFGGAFNEMGWNQLSTPALQDAAIQALFGEAGAHFVMGRIPIGASDYAMNRYSLDDATGSPGNDPTANSAGSNRPAADTSMANFSIARDKEKLIPYVKAALAVNPNLRLWASPWTPPIWMKTGYKTASGASGGGNAVKPSYFDGGNMKNDSATLNALGQYFVKWLQAYKTEGITIETVSPQNEPGYDQNYPSCLWDSATYISFVKVLGTALSGASLNVKIMGGTMSNGDSGKDGSILSAVMGDATAKTYIKVVGVQWGMLDNANSSPSTFSAYGVPLWATEHKCGNYPWDSAYKASAPNDQAYGVESWGYIRDAITKAKVTAYNAWNMVLDSTGLGIDTSRNWAQDALITVSGGNINKTPAYYVFSHISHFVDAGAKVVGATGGDTIAFKNPDGSIVAVMYNSGAAKTSTISIGGTKYSFSMPGQGWATVKK